MQPYYEREGITIYHGDCREILPMLDAGTVHVTITDAPYNTNENTGGTVIDYGPDTDESRPWPEYAAWLDDILLESERVSSGPVLCFVSKRGLMHMISRRAPWWLGQWVRAGQNAGNPTGPRTGVMFQPGYEPCLFYGNRYGVKTCLSDVWTYAQEADRLGHPCQKPLALLRRLVRDLKATSVLDPFMGSGTTLRAAKDLGVTAIGIDINERYCEMAARRLAQDVLLTA